ncbi:O-Antigen ligase [bacterium A37T11]|nr:O-Antigen ligase [bacterium A37T11]
MPDTAYPYKRIAAELLFCLSVLAIFLPIKVYPMFFLVSCLFSYLEKPRLSFPAWALFLFIFTGYASLIFLVHLPEDRLDLGNFIKLPLNFLFLYISVNWLRQRNNEALLRWLDITLHIVFALTLVQLLYYHQAAHFTLISGSPSSAKASALYRPARYFWGLPDKNMFGARIALLGFAYILLPLAKKSRLEWWRIILVFVLAWLSLSRTPLVALFIGILYLIWLVSTKKMRIVIGVASLVAIPVLAYKVLRIDHITASNDGMGVRLVYWKAFFQHVGNISPLGNGFLSGKAFLAQYADFYHGEPHVHNTFLTCYLDFGIIGFLSYVLFLYFFFKYCQQHQRPLSFWILAFLPLLAIMMILYTGYDNDLVLYLALIFLLGSIRPVYFKQLKLSPI